MIEEQELVVMTEAEAGETERPELLVEVEEEEELDELTEVQEQVEMSETAEQQQQEEQQAWVCSGPEVSCRGRGRWEV